ncbi:SUMF1/EgtB/PvdO family nonheme iron enzyme, partial [Pseudomonas syringae]
MKNTLLSLSAVLGLLLGGTALAATPVSVPAPVPAPGKTFKDCKDCPEMVVLPAGTFTMGAPEEEMGRQPDEGPLHDVTFAKPFAISQFQVLAGEWDAYIKSSGYKMPDGDT